MTEATIFANALAKTNPEERRTYLEQVCSSDPVLRERVESLLKSYAEAGSFLENAQPVDAALTGGLFASSR